MDERIPRFFSLFENSEKKEYVQCGLCPHGCILDGDGRSGICRVRSMRKGKPELPFYGYVTSLAIDPIEKKPLYHFRPGTEILSVGFTGCNLRCPFCQNWYISQSTDAPGRFYSPGDLLSAALNARTGKEKAAIAYTYSEPLVHAEFLLDCMKEAHKAGVANVLVSNGCVNLRAAAEILDLCDAANIDLKCFSEEIYEKILGGSLSAVIDFITMALEKNVHLELTTLIVPGLNNNNSEMDKCRDFIAHLESSGKVVPWHLSAYHPDYKWKEPPTDPAYLMETALRAREKISYVYAGNIGGGRYNFSNDTLCPSCGRILIRRRGFRADKSALSYSEEKGKFICASCGQPAPIL